MRGIVGISGTPGTGKKTVAPIVASLMGLPAAISLNSLAPRESPRWTQGSSGENCSSSTRLPPSCSVTCSPTCSQSERRRFVAVLRCEPSVLRKRLVERGYSPAKVTENVEAELIGVVLDECLRRFGSELVREYDTTSASPKDVAKAIARDAEAATAEAKARQRASPPGSTGPWTTTLRAS